MTVEAGARRLVLATFGAALVVGALVGLAVAALTPTVYTASATVFVAASASESTADLLVPAPVEQQAGVGYAGLATTPLVLRGVIADLHLDTTPGALARRIHAEDSDPIVRIDASDPSPARAAAIAGSVQEHLIEQVSALTTTSSGTAKVRLSTVLRPVVPSNPSSPVWPADVVVAALAGGVLWGTVVEAVLMIRAPRRPLTGELTAPSML